MPGKVFGPPENCMLNWGNCQGLEFMFFTKLALLSISVKN